MGTVLAVVVLSGLFVPPMSAAEESMLIQPDGKILVAGRTSPQAGAVARLLPDGSLDPSFGEGGFVVDRRLPGFRALALQRDGDIIGAAVGGFQLARYLPNGAPDPGFAGGGIGGSNEPDQVHSFYGGYGPAAVTVRPDGSIVVGGTRRVSGGGASEGLIRTYDRNGQLLGTIGRIPLPAGPASAARLSDLLEDSDGSFVGVGSTYTAEKPFETRPLLARFVSGSGADFDPGFGGGAGLVLPSFPTRTGHSNRLNALVESGGRLLAAGGAAGTLLLARFNADGTPDSGFGEGGFVAPKIQGSPDTAAFDGVYQGPSTWANDLDVTAADGVILGGGTSQWSEWGANKNVGIYCTECPQPVLARFDPDGTLDPGFGRGGLLRLARPDDGIFRGEIDQVIALAGGKLLVGGLLPGGRTSFVPFVARLNADGTYDRGFGEGGLATPEFPCADQALRLLRRSGCIPSQRLRLRLRRRRPLDRHPALAMSVRSNLGWAAVHRVTLTLPWNLRLTRRFRSRMRISAPGVRRTTKARVIRPGQDRSTSLVIDGFGHAPRVRLLLRRGSLRYVGPRKRRRLPAFSVGVEFLDTRWGSGIESQIVRRRAAGTRPRRATRR